MVLVNAFFKHLSFDEVMENLGLFKTNHLDSINVITNEFQFFAHGFRKILKPWHSKDAQWIS